MLQFKRGLSKKSLDNDGAVEMGGEFYVGLLITEASPVVGKTIQDAGWVRRQKQASIGTSVLTSSEI